MAHARPAFWFHSYYRSLRTMSTYHPDSVGAFMNRVSIPGAIDGPLSGKTFCVKDVFDVLGTVTGAGNPTFLETHEPASCTAPVVQALLDAGASLTGKTQMDELAYSLNGENIHYGTPANVAAPGRIPGGSSSGSAVAVAANLVDLGLGSDTAGSVRVPASYCGLLGFRPTHGRVSIKHCVPLAQSFDTVGWFSRDASLMRAVGRILLSGDARIEIDDFKWLVATDAFDLADDETCQAIYDAMSLDFSSITSILGPPKELCIGQVGGVGNLDEWLHTFRIIQASEAWANHGEWIQNAKPRFGPGIKERFEDAAKVNSKELAQAKAHRNMISDHVERILGSNGVISMPTCPSSAPRLNTPNQELENFRRRLLSLSVLAPLCRLPQVTLPIAEVEGYPVGLSFIGPRGSDEALLDLAEHMMNILPAAKGAAS